MKKISLFAIGLLFSTLAYAQQSDKVSVREMGIAPGPTPQAKFLVGTATNVTTSDLKTVILEFNLFDAQNAQVGNASAITQNLAAGGAWKFQALTVQPFDHAKLTRITAY